MRRFLLLALLTVACMPVNTVYQITGTPPPVTATLPVATATPFPVATITPVIDYGCEVATGIPDGALNLRTCGSVRCSVLAYLREGQPIIVLDTGDWYHVIAGSTAGWVNSDYIHCEKER